METLDITLKSVNDLLTEKFYIPSYQRGYRWTDVQVNDLLNDLWEFQDKAEQMSKEHFYCLQPLVVKKQENGTYEVVDGQQRLTTIYLMLTALKDILTLFNKSKFSLSYETRAETTESFLQDIQESRKDENIDFHHIYQAYETIQKWLEGRDGSHKLKLAQTLLNDDEAGKNVKVIWYELAETDDVIEAFTRLNMGKIPLTNSELIRALFLRDDITQAGANELGHLRVAHEWDQIERSLQRDDFWYFIYNGSKSNAPLNRIEHLFNQLVDETFPDKVRNGDAYHSFHCYNELLKQQDANLKREWNKLKDFYLMLEEWYQDRNLYHLTGYLISLGVPLTELREEALSAEKSAFSKYLKRRIFQEVFHCDPEPEEDDTLESLISEKLGDYSYQVHKPKLRAILLLFNITSLFENERSNMRFPFDSFKTEHWDVEHVSSVESSKPDRPDKQKEWLSGVKDCSAWITQFDGLREQIENVIDSAPFDSIAFDTLYEEILTKSGESNSRDSDDQLENLTLLDRYTNRSYKNAIFPVKRHRILNLDRSGIFVPLCTRNIFLKCYSQKLDNMMQWEDADKTDYRNHILQTLTRFFTL